MAFGFRRNAKLASSFLKSLGSAYWLPLVRMERRSFLFFRSVAFSILALKFEMPLSGFSSFKAV
ncbi:hypothetical protein [Desulfatibacillum alkenivorans]|uniref:hypothetical protein n=1 Tax=Desulfatibacillum alkenivorans TaxID=259354 RepID=UPI0009360818|nr:hypothetical protein [Desulfatibacillum alkenivorans]